jgi:hypothetical protein
MLQQMLMQMNHVLSWLILRVRQEHGNCLEVQRLLQPELHSVWHPQTSPYLSNMCARGRNEK